MASPVLLLSLKLVWPAPKTASLAVQQLSVRLVYQLLTLYSITFTLTNVILLVPPKPSKLLVLSSAMTATLLVKHVMEFYKPSAVPAEVIFHFQRSRSTRQTQLISAYRLAELGNTIINHLGDASTAKLIVNFAQDLQNAMFVRMGLWKYRMATVILLLARNLAKLVRAVKQIVQVAQDSSTYMSSNAMPNAQQEPINQQPSMMTTTKSQCVYS